MEKDLNKILYYERDYNAVTMIEAETFDKYCLSLDDDCGSRHRNSRTSISVEKNYYDQFKKCRKNFLVNENVEEDSHEMFGEWHHAINRTYLYDNINDIEHLDFMVEEGSLYIKIKDRSALISFTSCGEDFYKQVEDLINDIQAKITLLIEE